MTDLAYIFPEVSICMFGILLPLSKGILSFSLPLHIFQGSVWKFLYFQKPNQLSSSLRHLNNISSSLSCTALCCFYYNCPGLYLTLVHSFISCLCIYVFSRHLVLRVGWYSSKNSIYPKMFPKRFQDGWAYCLRIISLFPRI